VKFPVDKSASSAQSGCGLVPLRIGGELKAELRQFCRLRRTTLVMSVLTAYVALVLRWCKVPETVILYQTDGRFSSKLQNTIGYFAFPLCLRIKLLEDDRLVDLMNRVTEEYCESYKHADFAYMEAQESRPDFMRNTCFNWLTQDLMSGDLDLDGSEGAITYSQIPFEGRIVPNFAMDTEPMVGFLETGDEIRAAAGGRCAGNTVSLPPNESQQVLDLPTGRRTSRAPGSALRHRA